jgi:hypothetical protein
VIQAVAKPNVYRLRAMRAQKRLKFTIRSRGT